jgi:hypothetical protein
MRALAPDMAWGMEEVAEAEMVMLMIGSPVKLSLDAVCPN